MEHTCRRCLLSSPCVSHNLPSSNSSAPDAPTQQPPLCNQCPLHSGPLFGSPYPQHTQLHRIHRRLMLPPPAPCLALRSKFDTNPESSSPGR